MTTLSPRQPAQLARVTGKPVVWARDLSLVGTATAAGAVLGLGLLGTLGLATVGIGAVVGFVLGLLMPEFLEESRSRLSLVAIGMRCVTVGFAAGGFVGFASAGLFGPVAGDWWFLAPVLIGGLAGALQLGWWWLPYTVLTVTRRPTWPAVIVAGLVAPLVGPAAHGIASALVAMLP